MVAGPFGPWWVKGWTIGVQTVFSLGYHQHKMLCWSCVTDIILTLRLLWSGYYPHREGFICLESNPGLPHMLLCHKRSSPFPGRWNVYLHAHWNWSHFTLVAIFGTVMSHESPTVDSCYTCLHDGVASNMHTYSNGVTFFNVSVIHNVMA